MIFGRQKTNYGHEMREYLKEMMLQYISENYSIADDIVQIFSDAEIMIRNTPEKEICKMMKVNNVNMEHGALNILQNVAMRAIRPSSSYDFLRNAIKGDADPAYTLYININDIKLKKGYISEKQHKENEILATSISMNSPFI